MSRFVAPSIASAITALFVAAFVLQIHSDKDVPVGQWVTMAFLIIAVIWAWAESATQLRFPAGEAARGQSRVSSRVFWANATFPLIAWLVATCVAIVYFAAFNWIDPPGADGLRRALPEGFFIPAVVWTLFFGLLFAVTVVNKHANLFSAKQQTAHDMKVSNKQNLASQVALLAASVPRDADTMVIMRCIETKAAAFPLVVSQASVPIASRVSGEINALLGAGRAPSKEELERLLSLVTQVR